MTVQVRNEEIIENEPEEFDHRVTIRDPKTGVVIRHQPYRMEVTNGVKKYWRDGIEFFPNGRPVDPEIYAQHLEAKRNKRKQRALEEAPIHQQKATMLEEMTKAKNEFQESVAQQMKELSEFRQDLLEIARGLKANKELLETREKELAAREEKKPANKTLTVSDKGVA